MKTGKCSIQDLKVGDSIRVKSGVDDPDSRIDIGGWQGRIYEIDSVEELISIKWDSITLGQMDPSWIASSEFEGLDWTAMTLANREIESSQPRDTIKDVEKQIEKLNTIHRWDHLGAHGKRIGEILTGVIDDNSIKAFEAWNKHFVKALKFPFDAKVIESERQWIIKEGEEVTVLKITEVVEDYGTVVQVTKKGNLYEYPLCNLESKDKTLPLYQTLDDYRVWYANK